MKSSKVILFSIVIGLLLCIYSCDSTDDIGVTPETLPALFTAWRLSSETYNCGQSNNTNTPSSVIILELIRTYTFKLSENGSTISEGSIRTEGDQISFDPPFFQNALFEQVKFAFNGSDLVLTVTEIDLNNAGQSCSVRRVYKRN
ncbi:MAG: hypothetical protein HWE07_14420 [Cytophagia bacterium]|nr:hypothetical protein [Cytophagia bacterium]